MRAHRRRTLPILLSLLTSSFCFLFSAAPSAQTGELRDTALKTCGHVFCKKVVDGLVDTRRRKCPLCGVKFDKTDILKIWLWKN